MPLFCFRDSSFNWILCFSCQVLVFTCSSELSNELEYCRSNVCRPAHTPYYISLFRASRQIIMIAWGLRPLYSSNIPSTDLNDVPVLSFFFILIQNTVQRNNRNFHHKKIKCKQKECRDTSKLNEYELCLVMFWKL